MPTYRYVTISYIFVTKSCFFFSFFFPFVRNFPRNCCTVVRPVHTHALPSRLKIVPSSKNNQHFLFSFTTKKTWVYTYVRAFVFPNENKNHLNAPEAWSLSLSFCVILERKQILSKSTPCTLTLSLLLYPPGTKTQPSQKHPPRTLSRVSGTT